MGQQDSEHSSSRITRRRFLRHASAATVATSGLLHPRVGLAAAGPRRRLRPTVAVLGGGVGGLTAAHELAERGFDVTVYERRAFGGKARSMSVPGTGRGGRRPLPAEHGWREVFAGYQNLPDTMSRIPCGANPHGVLDNLVTTPTLMAARDNGDAPFFLSQPTAVPPTYTPVEALDTLAASLQWLPPDQIAYVLERFVVFLSSGDSRRLEEWERTAWPKFIDAERFSEGYRRFFVDLATRFSAAARGEVTSARTIGKAIESVIYFPLTGRGADRVLDAPTNEAWIDPWLRLLGRMGVKLRLGQTVTGLEMRDGRIAGARIATAHGNRTIRADWYVCALPVERARRLWNRQILAADPSLERTNNIQTGWMNGIQFYLREPTPIVAGPLVCLDSPWVVFGISQAQFWPGRDFSRDYGNGRVRDKFSAIITDWTTPGILYGKPAVDCTTDEIAHEAWAQIKRHLRYPGAPQLHDDLVLSWFLDPGIVRHRARVVGNDDPLFLPTVNSWSDRPTADTEIPNLLLAGDYVQVDFDITSMEGANEAARRAVNALLDRAGSAAPRCQVFLRQLPPEWATFRQLDEQRYKQGQPNLFDADLTMQQIRDLLNQPDPNRLLGDVCHLLTQLTPART